METRELKELEKYKNTNDESTIKKVVIDSSK